MTKDEILHIIEKNKDLLTPENYLKILKDVSIFTDSEKKRIAAYLAQARDFINLNNEVMRQRQEAYALTSERMVGVEQAIARGIRAAEEINKNPNL